tara:strand:- start:2847 stop:3866 length:1020 start_codon:yes stop_codon:yes gene_type:complete
MSKLNEIAMKIVSNGKGILAADESTGTMTKRLNSVGVESNPENRLKFRETLFSSDGMKKFIGGVILYDETIKQKTSSGITIPDLINKAGSVTGIKVDTGAKTLSGSSTEKITEGLDGLRERLQKYYELGARFTKWRAVYSISKSTPTKLSIISNAHALARYASMVQEAKMVPIVEPELLMDGNHDINKCYKVTSEILISCYEQLNLFNVDLSGTILKPNMILPGKDHDKKASTEEIAEMTVNCLKKNVPKEVAGIAFLSGGQSELEATKNLNTINKINDTKFVMTFSYGRALQQSALKYWSKHQEDLETTKKIFNHRSKMNSLSVKAEWTEANETKTAA